MSQVSWRQLSSVNCLLSQVSVNCLVSTVFFTNATTPILRPVSHTPTIATCRFSYMIHSYVRHDSSIFSLFVRRAAAPRAISRPDSQKPTIRTSLTSQPKRRTQVSHMNEASWQVHEAGLTYERGMLTYESDASCIIGTCRSRTHLRHMNAASSTHECCIFWMRHVTEWWRR